MNNRMQGNVKTDITKNEARDIYYNMFWKESGADKLEDPRDAMMLFDMAVNSGVTTAKQKFKESNNNFYTMLDNRRKFYDDCIKYKPEKSGFKEGWYNRLKDLENNANKIINEGFWARVITMK